jgi:phospholipid/cholesterol/gamma-HCH transport system substrate-binding protein
MRSGAMPRLGRLALIAQALAALAFVVVLLRAEGVQLPFIDAGDWTIEAAFTDVSGMHTGERTPVLVSGVPVGTVTGVRLDHGVAIATLRLDASARGLVRSDATAAVEPRSALEDMTIDVTPGSSTAPPASPGMRIAAANTAPTVTLDQVLAVLDSDTRAQLTILIDQLSRGIGGRGGQLSGAVAQLHSLLSPAIQVGDALARRRLLLTKLVGALSRLGVAAEQHDAALAASLSAAARTLAVTSGQEAAITSSVQQLPSTMTTLTGALDRVRTLATPLAPALRTLEGSANALPGSLGAVRQAAPPARTLLAAAGAFARDGGAGVHAGAGVLSMLAPTSRALTPAIARIEPIVAAVNSRRTGIAQLGERFSGVLSTSDANGPILRGLGTFEPFNPADFGAPGASGAERLVLASQAAQALTLTCLHGGLVACLVRYLVPGLPGSVR